MAAKKKGRPTKAEIERTRQQELRKKRQQERYQVGCILLLVFALFVCAVTYIEGEHVWAAMHAGLFGLFGPVAYAVGPVLIYLAIVTALERRLSSSRVFFAVMLMISICGAVLIFKNQLPAGETFPAKLSELYTLGTMREGGGVFSAVFGWSLMAMFGRTGAAVTICLLMFLFAMLVTGRTIAGIIAAAKDTGEKTRERVQQRRELREQQELEELERQKELARQAVKVIDIPLDENNPPRSAIDVPLEGPVKTAASAAARGKSGNAIDISMGPDPAPVTAEPDENELKRSLGEVFDIVEKEEGGGDSSLDSLINKVSEKHANLSQSEGSDTPVTSPEQPDNYKFPPITLLKRMGDKAPADLDAELRANADKLVRTLDSFGVRTRVVDISRGPTVTRYELQPYSGVKISRISALSDDIALNLATAGVRIEAPIPNKSAVGIEVPNREKAVVSLRSVIESREFRQADEPLTVAMGKDIDGKVRVADITRMPHMLVAGATNSGKSVCLNCMIMSVLYKASPSEVRLILIDPKSVELIGYNGLPHLLIPVVTNPKNASGALGWAVGEMMKRYKLFADRGVKNLDSYNRMVDNLSEEDRLKEENEDLQKLPRILIIIDELSDLMMAAPREVEDSICRLAQLARAAGMHLIVATQRPSVDVVTGLIKANIPSRVAFAVSSQIDSRTILGGAGAEKLLGRGDMLYMPMEMNKPVRLQGCYISEEETAAVIDYIKKNETERYDESVSAEIEKIAANTKCAKGTPADDDSEDDTDPMFEQAVDVVVEAGQASTSMLQRKLKLGFSRAGRIIDEMEDRGIVGPSAGSKGREVLISPQQWQEYRLNRSK